MHRSIATIMLIMVSLFAKAQNYQTITRVVYEQQRISGYNSLNKLAVQVDCKDMVWQVLPDNSIKIWDDIHSFTVIYTTLSVPAFAALGDSLRAWQVSCGQSSISFPTNLDTTHIDTSLIVPTLIENFSNRNNDTLSAILAAITAHDVNITGGLLHTNNILESIMDNQQDGTQLSNIYDSNTGAVATVLQGAVNSTNSNTAIVVSERPQAAQFGAIADLVTSHTTSSVIPTASTLEVIVENIGTASTTITYQGVAMPIAANQQRYFYAIWDEARRVYSPIGTLVVNGTGTATIVVTRKNPQ